MALTSNQADLVFDRVSILLRDRPAGTDDLLQQLIADAAAWAEAYTQRTKVPDQLLGVVGDLAIVAYNRMGTEGEAGRSEGGESYSFETAPAHIYDVLNRYRLARIGGATYETANTEEA